jgi:hypothetical protein
VQRFYKKLGFGSCGSKFQENRPLFIGLLVPCHREQGVLPNLSIRGPQIATYNEKSKKREGFYCEELGLGLSLLRCWVQGGENPIT